MFMFAFVYKFMTTVFIFTDGLEYRLILLERVTIIHLYHYCSATGTITSQPIFRYLVLVCACRHPGRTMLHRTNRRQAV